MQKYKREKESVATSSDFPIGVLTMVLGCFLLSGLTGLIYEILWTRMIVKIVGTAPFAVSIILTVFMGGLGLGSFLASRMIDQVKEPHRLLKIYALLELAIAGYAIVLPGLVVASKPIYCVLYNELFNHFLLYNVLTLIGCFILLLIPVCCMGATLPVLCRFYVIKLGHLGTRAGRLYALNTIGAAVGSLLCGFFLINFWDVWGTLSFAVLLNVLIGLNCLSTSHQVKKQSINEDLSSQGSKDVSITKTIHSSVIPSHFSSNMVVGLLIFAVSGFCAMAYEVIWTRLLGLIIGPTTYSFTIILATFIVGLALGSLIFGRLADKIKNPLWLLLFTQIVAAFLALGISQLLGNSQFFFAKLIDHFKDQFAQLVVMKAGILFAFMLGPTLCLGATFPLVGKIYTQSLTRVGRSIGFAYAINTLGAVSGAFCAGFLLIPWFGKEHSLSLVTGIQLLSSLAVGGYLLWKKRSELVRYIPLSVMAFLGLILCFNFPCWNRQLLSTGRYHRFDSLSPLIRSHGWLETLWLGPKILKKHKTKSELMYYGDGIGGFTTVVKEIDALGTPQYTLVNSGKADASSQVDMPTQTLLAHIPLLFHPNPKEIMVLGLASGITAGEVLHYPVERLDIIEISPQVVSASNFFAPWNNQVLLNPKTELIIQDGRAHLELTRRTYDVIISEPSNPWMAGLSSLFTRDFFLLAKDRLNEDGIFVQFFHSYQMDWDTFALVGRTFSQVFPHGILMTTIPGATENPRIGSDYLLIGFKGENRLLLNHAEKSILYARQSKNITLPNPKLLYRLVVSEDLQKLFGSGHVHSDSHPHLEFAAPKQMYTVDPTIEKNIWSKRWLSRETRTILREIANVEDQIAFATFALSVYKPFHNMIDLSKATDAQKKRFFKIMEDYCSSSLIKDYSIFTDQALKERCLSIQIETIQNNIHLVSDTAAAYNHLGNAYHAKGELQLAMDCYQKALAINPESTTAHTNLGNIFSAMGMLEKSISEYKKSLKSNPDLAKVHINLGNVYAKKGMLDKAITEYKEALAIQPRFSREQTSLSAHANNGTVNEAISSDKRVIITNPAYAKAHRNLGAFYFKKGELEKAISEYKKAIAINPIYAKAHCNLGAFYFKKGELNKAISECKKAIDINPTYAKAHNNLARVS